MPTYEYLCRACNHRFEAWQKMTDEPLTTCPECGGQIRRVLFPAGIVFKGSGFYKTDHAAKNGAGENGHSSKSESAKSETLSEKKSTEGGAPSSKAGESKVPAEAK